MDAGSESISTPGVFVAVVGKIAVPVPREYREQLSLKSKVGLAPILDPNGVETIDAGMEAKADLALRRAFHGLWAMRSSAVCNFKWLWNKCSIGRRLSLPSIRLGSLF